MQWRQCIIQCLCGNNGMKVLMGGPNRISCPFLPAACKRRKMITTITVIISKDVCKVANADQAGWPLLPPKDLYSSMSKYGTYLLSAKTIGSHTRHTEFLHGLNAKIINFKIPSSANLFVFPLKTDLVILQQ